MIVADTGAMLALIDKSDRHHATLMKLFDEHADEWVLPWAILPEVDYLVGAHVSAKAQEAWLDDLAAGAFPIEWGTDADLTRAREIARTHRALRLGLVDTVVMALAERLQVEAVATLDLRHLAPWPSRAHRGCSARSTLACHFAGARRLISSFKFCTTTISRPRSRHPRRSLHEQKSSVPDVVFGIPTRRGERSLHDYPRRIPARGRPEVIRIALIVTEVRPTVQ